MYEIDSIPNAAQFVPLQGRLHQGGTLVFEGLLLIGRSMWRPHDLGLSHARQDLEYLRGEK